MKLYIWDSCVFKEYGMGIAVALANNLEQARKQFPVAGGVYSPSPRDVKPTKVIDCDKRKNPYSVYMIGSD